MEIPADATAFSLMTTMTIATPTGEGVTSARSFTRLRRCVLYGDFRIC